MVDGEQGGEQPQHEHSESEDEHVVVGESGLDPLRNEHQPTETGSASAPPAESLSGVGATGVPENPGAQGGPAPAAAEGEQAEVEQA